MLTLGETMTIGDKEYVLKDFTHNGLGSITSITVELNDPQKWWFDPRFGCVENVKMYPGALEVTAEYADYLRNKPDGEWELRIPKDGDEIMDTDGMGYRCGKLYITVDLSPRDRGYRWCKPKTPATGWREYPVIARRGVYYVKGYNGSDMALHKALCRVSFGGMQYEGQDTWCALVAAYVDSGGLHTFSHKHDSKLATPVKVRFWEAKQ